MLGVFVDVSAGSDEVFMQGGNDEAMGWCKREDEAGRLHGNAGAHEGFDDGWNRLHAFVGFVFSFVRFFHWFTSSFSDDGNVLLRLGVSSDSDITNCNDVSQPGVTTMCGDISILILACLLPSFVFARTFEVCCFDQSRGASCRMGASQIASAARLCGDPAAGDTAQCSADAAPLEHSLMLREINRDRKGITSDLDCSQCIHPPSVMYLLRRHRHQHDAHRLFWRYNDGTESPLPSHGRSRETTSRTNSAQI